MSLKTIAASGIVLVLAACNAEAPDANTQTDSSEKTKAMASEETKTPTTTTEPTLKLYTMSCGEIDISDLSGFSRGGEFAGKSRVFVDSCYLIRHKNGDLMWDAGLPDELAQTPEGVVNGVFRVSVPVTLASQLEQLEVDPSSISFFAMSHSHFDHTGNANLFASGPKWIVDATEYEWMFNAGPETGLTQLTSYEKLKNKTPILISEDYDVFGDGSVTIVRTPGHTPGHLSLLLKLPNTGNILLTGDLYHMPESREFRRVPAFNTSPEQTLTSMDKFEALAKEKNAKVIIQHSREDVESLPEFPTFAD